MIGVALRLRLEHPEYKAAGLPSLVSLADLDPSSLEDVVNIGPTCVELKLNATEWSYTSRGRTVHGVGIIASWCNSYS